MHRRAIALDGAAELVAGCFSRDAAKNTATARDFRVAGDRVYADFESMAREEAAREDGIDFVVVVTPNDTHHRIVKTFLEHSIHVPCDKPLTTTVADADELVALASARAEDDRHLPERRLSHRQARARDDRRRRARWGTATRYASG